MSIFGLLNVSFSRGRTHHPEMPVGVWKLASNGVQVFCGRLSVTVCWRAKRQEVTEAPPNAVKIPLKGEIIHVAHGRNIERAKATRVFRNKDTFIVQFKAALFRFGPFTLWYGPFELRLCDFWERVYEEV